MSSCSEIHTVTLGVRYLATKRHSYETSCGYRAVDAADVPADCARRKRKAQTASVCSSMKSCHDESVQVTAGIDIRRESWPGT
jgi:hypothetical protein